jgi:hypothetical protein
MKRSEDGASTSKLVAECPVKQMGEPYTRFL